jgi:hypothetical protein
MRQLFVLFFVSSCFVLGAEAISAQTKYRVRFPAGTSSASIKGTVRGFAYRDYLVKASAGQTIEAKLVTPNTFSVLTIFLPDGNNLEGAAQTDEFTGELPTGGDYVIRVGMMRAEARRPRSVSNYTLRISIK